MKPLRFAFRIGFGVFAVFAGLFAQTDPNNDPNWDWTASTTYTVYPQLPYGAPVYTTSPFYQGGIGEAVFDNDQEDGWRLVIRDFGTPTRGQAIPHFVLYNIHQGLLRIFLFVKTTNTFTTGSVELFFGSTAKTAGLTFLKSRAWATDRIDSVKDNRSGAVTPAADNYWSFADFPMAYDPGTSSVQNPRFHFRIWGVQQNTINLTGWGTINQVFGTNQPANVPTANPFSEGGLFNAAYKSVQGTQDSWNKWREGIDKMANGIDSNSTWSVVRNLRIALKNLKNTWLISNLGGIGVGVGLIDFFITGGRTNTQERPAPMNFVMNYRLDGSMTTQHLISPGVTVPVPGATHTEQAVPVDLLYTQPLGILNLTQTPILQYRTYYQEIEPGIEMLWDSFRLRDDVVWVMNPNAQLAVGTLEAAIVYHLPEQPPGQFPDYKTMFLNWAEQGVVRLESANDGKYVFSTGYFPIDKVRYQIVANVPPGTDMTIKVKGILNRQGAPAGTQPIVFVATYEPDFAAASGSGPWWTGGLIVPSDYPTISEALNKILPGKTVYANPGTHNIGSYTTVPGGSALQLSPNATLTFGSTSRLLVYGNLISVGYPSYRIALDGQGYSRTGTAMAMVVVASGGTANIQYTDFRNAAYGLTLWSSTGNVTVQNCTFTNFSYTPSAQAITVQTKTSGSATISSNTITGSSSQGTGISAYNTGTNVTISSNTITYCGTGINVGTSNASLTSNIIRNNWNYGIQAYNVASFVDYRGNDVRSNGYGVSLISAPVYLMYNTIIQNNRNVFVYSCSPSLATRPDEGDVMRGHNTVAYAGSPLIEVQNYSNVYMGYDYEGGYNSVFETDLPHLWVTNHSGVWAANNYWGLEGPTYYVDGTSWALTTTPLWSNPNQDPLGKRDPTGPKTFASQFLSKVAPEFADSTWKGEFLSALSAASSGDLSSATNRLEQIALSGSSKYAPLALLAYHDLVQGKWGQSDDSVGIATRMRSLLKSLNAQAATNPLRPFALRLLARDAALARNDLETNFYRTAILKDYPNSSHELATMYDQVVFYARAEDDMKKAVEVLSSMRSKYPHEILTWMARLEVGENVDLRNAMKRDIADVNGTATDVSMNPAYPNPFNPSTTIRFRIPTDGFVSLSVFDILGREVTALMHGEINAGDHTVVWNASSVPSGVYFLRLDTRSTVLTQKLLLVR